MIAAVYARKSTEQNGIAADQKSVTRQIDHARAYATRKGWIVADDHIYVDDGISGAEFTNRPGFLRLMNALKPRAPFNVLIMSEESRLGREAIETAYALKQIVTANVRVYFYLENRERTLDSPTDKIMLSLTAFADELEREKGRQRTYDAMLGRARKGYACGGACFGYRNVEVRDATGKRSHVERQIDQDEAQVVRRIFTLCAAGHGWTAITKILNAERVPAPRPQQGRPAAWAGSSVRAVLFREAYVGRLAWNKSRKRDQWGRHHQTDRPATEWIHVPAPALQIVSTNLWEAAHRQMTDRKAKYQAGNRPTRDSSYLLSGFAKCAGCGGGFASHLRKHGRDYAKFYACTSFWKRGPAVCANNLIGPMDLLDRAVLGEVRRLLQPAVIERAIAKALARLSPARVRHDQNRAVSALGRIEAECRRLATAIGQGGPLEALVDRLRACERERDALRGQLERHRSHQTHGSPEALESRLRGKLAEWNDLLTADIETGRQVLRLLVADPFRFVPIVEDQRRGYQFRGTLALDQVVAGVIDLPALPVNGTGSAQQYTGVASPRGLVVSISWPLPCEGYQELPAA